MHNDFSDTVLKDLREGEKNYCIELERIKGWKNPNERLKIYCANKRKDADHYFEAVLQTYENYPVFKGKLSASPGEIIYKVEGNGIRLTGDLLTNVAAVDDWVEKHQNYLKNEENRKVLNAFYKVSYTKGNFSPIWKNPTFGRGNDNVWYKLSTIDIDQKEKWEEISKRLDTTKENESPEEFNLSCRKSEGLFMILQESNPTEVIKKLFFMDYFDYNWKLRWKKETYVPGLNEEDFAEYLRVTTVLLIQRSYRIDTCYKGTLFGDKQKKELRFILEQLGLGESELIYSKKRRKTY